MKKPIILLGLLLLVANAGAAALDLPEVVLPVQIGSAALGLAVALAASRIKRPPAQAPAPPPPAAAPAPPPPPRPEAEIVAFLALLQEHARLVDFAKEDITSASDAQLAPAARVVHAGCRKVLDDYFEIAPLRTEKEGTRITLEPGFDAPAHRLLGSVPEQPPYHGQLLHPGWIASSVKLPRVTGTTSQRPWPVLAPAEVTIS
jgi:hypothetical protein